MSASEPVSPGVRFGRFEILTAERRLHVDGKPVALGSRAFDLLAALVARRDRVVSKDELMEVVWPGLVVEDNNLQVQISALRKVLGTQSIATVAGRGYQFTVAAPMANVPAALLVSEARAVRRPMPTGTTMTRPSRLLVADDNKVNRLLLCRSLELMGHDVASADNGRTALEKLRGEHFDLLLLDLEMPEIDGFGLLEQRAGDATLRDVPVIVTSSLEGAAPVARCIELGADDYLHKPVNPVLLQARVDSSLERKRLRDHERELLARLSLGAADTPQGPGAAADGHRVQATLLVAQLSGAEALMAALSPADAMELLSNWTTLMLDAIEGHGGRVTQLTGATLVAVFGTGASANDGADAPASAAQAALEMVQLAAMFNAERSASGKEAVVAGIGIASGEVLAGNAGTPRRAAYVCIGAAAQRAAQLAALVPRQGGPILVDAATHAALAGRVAADAVPATLLAGSSKAAPAYALKAA
ncbi:MAG: response regulator [Caldimonas sp.]